jgi:hypothetical protein
MAAKAAAAGNHNGSRFQKVTEARNQGTKRAESLS